MNTIMKKLNRLSFATLVAFLFFALAANAQKIDVYKGKISALKGVKSFTTEYDYSDMKVGKKTESKYVSEKVKDKNKEERGTGDKWKEEWFGNREARFEPKFEELFNEYHEGGKIEDGGEVKMLIHTTMTEPGFNVGVARRPALIFLDIEFQDASGKTLCKVRIDKAPGGAMGYDFDMAYRIQEGYAKAAKSLAKYMNKKVK